MKASRLPVSALLPSESTLTKITRKGNLVSNLANFVQQIETNQHVVVIPATE